MGVYTKRLILFTLLFSMFFPTFNSSLGGVEGYANRGSVILNFSIIVLCFFSIFQSKFTRTFINAFLFFFFSFSLVIVFPTLFFSDKLIFRDVFEIHRPLLYLLTFLTGYVYKENFSISSLEKTLFYSLAFISILAILQPFRVVDFISIHYTETSNIITKRATGTMLNPYDFGLVMSLLTYYCYSKILNGNFNIKVLTAFLLSISSVMFTQSRTAVFSTIIGLCLISFLYFIFYILFRRGSYKTSLFSIFILSSLLVFLVAIWGYVEENLVYLVQATLRLLDGNDTSANIRYNQVQHILSLKDDDIFLYVFGNGVSKGIIDIIENQYFLYFYRYGLLGLFLLLSIMSMFSIFSYMSLVLYFGGRYLHFYMALFVWSLLFFVASFGNPFVDIIRVQFIYFFLLGVCVNYKGGDFEYCNVK